MERNYQFKEGQRVKMLDKDDNRMVYGTVTDKTAYTVFIKWEDLSEPTEHEQHEFCDIKLIN